MAFNENASKLRPVSNFLFIGTRLTPPCLCNDMSDTESIVSSVCENVSSATDLSDTESIESSESERFEKDTLTLYEYVSVTINIEATLASDFKRHARYYRTPGKLFLVDSLEAKCRMYQLID